MVHVLPRNIGHCTNWSRYPHCIHGAWMVQSISTFQSRLGVRTGSHSDLVFSPSYLPQSWWNSYQRIDTALNTKLPWNFYWTQYQVIVNNILIFLCLNYGFIKFGTLGRCWQISVSNDSQLTLVLSSSSFLYTLYLELYDRYEEKKEILYTCLNDLDECLIVILWGSCKSLIYCRCLWLIWI